MEKYINLKKVLNFLTCWKQFDTEQYRKDLQWYVQTYHKEPEKEFLLHLRKEVEASVLDPSFDWLQVSWETEFNYTLEEYPSNPTNTSEKVFFEFQLIAFDILYPERALSPAEQELLRRTVLYLLLDIMEDKGRIWVSSTALLHQLRHMNPAWGYLSDYHLNLLNNYFFEFESGYYSNTKINKLRLYERQSTELAYLDILKQCIEKRLKPYADLPIFEWPPFKTSRDAKHCMTYFKPDWLALIHQYPAEQGEPPS